MLKKNISIFLTILFMITITLPSVLVIIDDSIDISMFCDISEEEEEKGNEKNKEIEVLFEDFKSETLVFSTSKQETNLGYCYKTYPKPHLNLIFPPPEYTI